MMFVNIYVMFMNIKMMFVNIYVMLMSIHLQFVNFHVRFTNIHIQQNHCSIIAVCFFVHIISYAESIYSLWLFCYNLLRLKICI